MAAAASTSSAVLVSMTAATPPLVMRPYGLAIAPKVAVADAGAGAL